MPGGFCLTSSRDEKPERLTDFPQAHIHPHGEVIYPKDLKAGGTWIAASRDGKAACLLNGAFEAHRSNRNYEKSRGKLLLEFFEFNQIPQFLEKVSLHNIEPFTLLMLDYKAAFKCVFYGLRWDGTIKHIKKLCPETSYIWSSATLYQQTVRESRKQLFKNWIEKYKDFGDRLIYHFHAKKHGLAADADLLMENANGVKTVSISQIRVCHDEERFDYTDVQTNKHHSVNLLNTTTKLSA